jgi:hypothetical protein
MANTIYRVIKDKLVTQLQTIDKVQDVYGYPNLEFKGYPAATIYPADQFDASYDTTIDNKRHYIFIVSLYYEIPKSGTEEALDALFDLTDDVMDLYDDDEFLTGISLPADYTMIGIYPTFARWGQVPDKQVLVVDIQVRVVVTHDVS